jgi:GNAT superfamily N-acetyltransferase
MASYKIRELRVEDQERMADLIKTRQDVQPNDIKKRLQLMQWVAFNNPFANGKPTYFVALDGPKIIAHLGRMPAEFLIAGKKYDGYYVHDLYVHPEYRSKGHGFFITVSLYKTIEDKSDSFCCLVWTTDLNLEIQRRRGYYELRGNRYYKFFEPYQKLRQVIKNDWGAKVAARVLQIPLLMADWFLLNMTSSALKVIQTESFDARFDHINIDSMAKNGICPDKTLAYLAWRHTDRPYGNTQIFTAEENKTILGYAVVSITRADGYPEGVLLDIMADPDRPETISSLIRAVVHFLKKQKVHTIRCCLTDKRYARVLKKFLFFRDFLKTEPLLIANLDKFEDKDILTEIDNWHLTYSASDELMLEPLS